MHGLLAGNLNSHINLVPPTLLRLLIQGGYTWQAFIQTFLVAHKPNFKLFTWRFLEETNHELFGHRISLQNMWNAPKRGVKLKFEVILRPNFFQEYVLQKWLLTPWSLFNVDPWQSIGILSPVWAQRHQMWGESTNLGKPWYKRTVKKGDNVTLGQGGPPHYLFLTQIYQAPKTLGNGLRTLWILMPDHQLRYLSAYF